MNPRTAPTPPAATGMATATARVTMGMAMTMLSFGMFVRTDSAHTWASLNPANVYASAEDHAARLWDRGVKQYQSSKLVFEIQSRYEEWAAEEKQTGEQK